MSFNLHSAPTALRERIRLLNDQASVSQGAFVLYWAHHALRAEDNPALDTALWIGDQHDLPVLVYQGLAGKHGFNSDRHHTFILQGARDFARQLRMLDISYGLHVPSDDLVASPLNTLVANAAAVVMEMMPVAPFNRWQPALAARASGPVLQVDARCIVPMTLSQKAPSRAFAFRDKFKAEYQQRINTGWDYRAPAAKGRIKPMYDTIDIEQFSDDDIADLVARQPIDHSIPPVADTVGGTRAGLARWHRFANDGLKRYDKTRNDAARDWPNSVSRMSPYLHYGMVSPFRIATDAAHHGGSGATKFLDELTIWRELAHHFCVHSDDPDSLAALPSWAVKTLNEHRDDDREREYSDVALAHGKTHSLLWNLAQQSLLIHGELHNNLRMTWAKAIPRWSDTPEIALQRLIDLNHRYALDGNDPASYGGLLWALGLFDRPFTPPQPVLGNIRTRPIKAHAKRLDMQRYREKILRPQSRRQRIAVIGAGIAGLSAASVLSRHQHDVTVFEKSRGPGGRTATRRSGEFRFNHGAQYFTANDQRLKLLVPSLLTERVLAPYSKRIVALSEDGMSAPTERVRYRGEPGMNDFCKWLADGLLMKTSHTVASIQPTEGRWTLRFAESHIDEIDGFDAVLLSAPAPQTAALLQPIQPAFAELANTVEMTPTWALMLRTETVPKDFDSAFVAGDPIAWMASDIAKDGDACWVLHASPEWSETNLERPREDVAAVLSRCFEQRTGLAPIEGSVMAHRWRYARVTNPLQDECLFDINSNIGVCGDWCHDGARVESAWLSGQALAGRLLGVAALRDRNIDGQAALDIE
ncbi:MAG: FAD-dependent oxidoreductase [Pseudomonadota bacterium]